MLMGYSEKQSYHSARIFFTVNIILKSQHKLMLLLLITAALVTEEKVGWRAFTFSVSEFI